jgi:hypothetical protein
MNRDQLIVFLAQAVVIRPWSFKKIAVFLPKREDSKKFGEDLYSKIDEIPGWLMPTVKRKTQSRFETDNLCLLFTISAWSLKGQSLDAVYVSDQHSEKEMIDIRQCVLPALRGREHFSIFNERQLIMKMYICLKEDLPVGIAINTAAHASLLCHESFGDTPNYREWYQKSFKKVTCAVSPAEFSSLKMLTSALLITEDRMGGQEVGIVLCPRHDTEWPEFVNLLKLWK